MLFCLITLCHLHVVIVSLFNEVLLSLLLLLPLSHELASRKYVFVQTAIVVRLFIQLLANNDATVKEEELLSS